MKKIVVSIFVIVICAAIGTTGALIYKKKNAEIDNLKSNLNKAMDEFKKTRTELENSVFKKEIIAKKYEVLKQKIKLVNKAAIEIQTDTEGAGKQIEAILEEKKLLENRLENLSQESKKQLETERKESEAKLELIENEYSQQMEGIQREFKSLKSQAEILRERKKVLEDSITQAMAEAGREKFKFHYYNQGLSFEYYNRYQEAVKQYKKALQVDPDAPEVYLQLSSIYTYDIIDFEKAEFYAKKYAKLKYIESLMPEDIDDIQKSAEELPLPFLKEKLAEISFAKVNLEGKVSSMKESFKEKQEQINRLKKIAQKKEVIELQLQETEKTFKEETLKFHYNMALTYDRSKFYKNAAKEYLEALKIFPDDPDSHYNLALVYDDHLKDRSKAIRHYKRYLELRPGGSDATKVEYWIVRAEKEMESEGQVFWPKKKDY